MNIKFTGLVLGTALTAFALTGCETTSNTNVNVNKVNSNTAVVVNDNTNAVVTNTNARSSNVNWNANITREEYDKDKTTWENRAKETGSTVGQGANDLWLWTKTRAALATTDDLRESTINVDVENDVVTLRGTVGTAAQKTKAEQVAKGIEGVKSVKNNLTVSAGDSVTNQMTGGNTNANTKANANK